MNETKIIILVGGGGHCKSVTDVKSADDSFWKEI